MKRVVLIFEDSPEGKALSAEYRLRKHVAMLRNPAMWVAPDPAKNTRGEGAHLVVVPKDAPRGDAIAAFYASAQIPVHRALEFVDLDAMMPQAAAQDDGDGDVTAQDESVEIPQDWQSLKPWTKKVSLAKKINPNFEPAPEDRVGSAERVIEAELERRKAQMFPSE